MHHRSIATNGSAATPSNSPVVGKHLGSVISVSASPRSNVGGDTTQAGLGASSLTLCSLLLSPPLSSLLCLLCLLISLLTRRHRSRSVRHRDVCNSRMSWLAARRSKPNLGSHCTKRPLRNSPPHSSSSARSSTTAKGDRQSCSTIQSLISSGRSGWRMARHGVAPVTVAPMSASASVACAVSSGERRQSDESTISACVTRQIRCS